MFGTTITSSFFAMFAVTVGAQTLVAPTESYYGGFNSTNVPTLLRIATGGAGQSGLVKGTQYSVYCYHDTVY
jgi:hypothetical protein